MRRGRRGIRSSNSWTLAQAETWVSMFISAGMMSLPHSTSLLSILRSSNNDDKIPITFLHRSIRKMLKPSHLDKISQLIDNKTSLSIGNILSYYKLLSEKLLVKHPDPKRIFFWKFNISNCTLLLILHYITRGDDLSEVIAPKIKREHFINPSRIFFQKRICKFRLYRSFHSNLLGMSLDGI